MGVGRRLRKLRRGIQIIGVEPSRSHHRQEGLPCLNAFCPEIFNREELDEIILVDDEVVAQTACDLFLREGLFVGISSGSTVFGAMQKTEELKEGIIVAIFGDHGFKYLSTGLFT
jgi:cysteine synthase